jgi:beta-glucosidase
MQVAHHLLLSHGLALQALRADGCRAPLGIVLNLSPVQAASDDAADLAAARLEDALRCAGTATRCSTAATRPRCSTSWAADAPWVGPGDMAAIATPMDFLGINNYSRTVVQRRRPWDVKAQRPAGHRHGLGDLPAGLTELLLRLHRDYAPPAATSPRTAPPSRPAARRPGARRRPHRYLQRPHRAVAEAMAAGRAVAATWSGA